MITPEQLAAGGSEHGAQAALFCWAAQNKDKYPELEWMFAIPNGGARNIITAARMKAEGVKSGVPDIFLPVPSTVYKGLFIELKTIKGVVSPDQKKWIEHLLCLEYDVKVCVGWEHARDTIVSYLERK